MSDLGPPEELYKLVHGKTDARTFGAFAELYSAAKARPGRQFRVDCSELQFCNGNLSAALRVLHGQLGRQSSGLVFVNLKPDVKSILRDAGLFGPKDQRQRGSVVPMTPFASGESSRFDLYVQKGLLGKGLPKMSASLEQHFFTGIHELFTNFEIHSQSGIGAWACAQVFPHDGRVEMTLVDGGIGIPSKIMQLGFAQTPQSAINWAMTGTNTTRQGDVPGGLGLKVLRDFITLNRGELTIVSHEGFWREAQGRVDMRPLAHPFPGTAVTIVVNTNDTQSYRLTSEIKPGDIF